MTFGRLRQRREWIENKGKTCIEPGCTRMAKVKLRCGSCYQKRYYEVRR